MRKKRNPYVISLYVAGHQSLEFSSLSSSSSSISDLSSEFDSVPDPSTVPDPTVPDPNPVPDFDPVPPVPDPARSRANSCSSSSSDDIIIIPHYERSRMPNIAAVEGSNSKVPPTLTAGRVNPEVLHQ